MRKRLAEKSDSRMELINDLGKQRLILYARSFRDLAKTYSDNETEYDRKEDRQEYIVKRRLYENREVLADHMNEMADILCLEEVPKLLLAIVF